jgi:glutathione peroxidase
MHASRDPGKTIRDRGFFSSPAVVHPMCIPASSRLYGTSNVTGQLKEVRIRMVFTLVHDEGETPMKSVLFSFIILTVAIMTTQTAALPNTGTADKATGAYAFTMKTIDGKEKHLSDYQGKVALIVNVASFCGNTKQYAALEDLYKKYKDKGFVILGFPANNFGAQEPGTDAEIKNFCTSKYDVTFDMFSKISVKGEDQHPFYKYLTTDTGFNGDIEWNFAKFLVDKHGTVAARYKPKTVPMDEQVIKKIEELLSEK